MAFKLAVVAIEVSMSKPAGKLNPSPKQWRLWLGLVLVALAFYAAYRQSQQPESPRPAERPSPAARDDGPPVAIESEPRRETRRADRPTTPNRAIVRNQTIYDLDGEVAYQGDVDLTDTLARIEAGRRLRYGNDGSTFQNRERRLPKKGTGYYKEYVHPTPGLAGPGPQRVVVGQGGEAYYTPDHYETFQRVDD
jgi:ribonuclease T1